MESDEHVNGAGYWLFAIAVGMLVVVFMPLIFFLTFIAHCQERSVAIRRRKRGLPPEGIEWVEGYDPQRDAKTGD